jgi:hypothetical protein
MKNRGLVKIDIQADSSWFIAEECCGNRLWA